VCGSIDDVLDEGYEGICFDDPMKFILREILNGVKLGKRQ
jgi:hypothetical protein